MSKIIMITNDDGIDSSGIIRLAAAAKKYGEVWVIAPHIQNSAASHSINLRDPIDVFEHDFPVSEVKAFAVKGTPADCVRVGIHGIMPVKPDMVLSGINFGYNAGADVPYSATLGAAFEAVFQGIRAVAFSEGLEYGEEVTKAYLDKVLDEVMKENYYREGYVININFPACPAKDVKGILRDRTCSRWYPFRDRYKGTEIPGMPGGKRYVVEGTPQKIAEGGSDLRAVYDGYISVGKLNNMGYIS